MTTYDAKLLAAVALAQSKGETRYYLCGVFLEGPYAVAADGHVLTCAYFPEVDEPAPGRILPVSAKVITAAKKAAAEQITFSDAGIVRVETDAGEPLHMEPFKEIDGDFPDWRRVVPNTPPAPTSAQFYNNVIEALTNTARILKPGKDSRVSLAINGPDAAGPHIVRYGGFENIFSVAMPMRGDEVFTIPDWLNAKRQAAA